MKNEYYKKRVQPKDQKSCLICGNPTVTVLFNPTGPDWLYTCDIHLKDNPQFVKPLYPPEYDTVLKTLESLKRKITEVSQAEGGMWDQWINKFLKSKNEAPTNDTPQDNNKKHSSKDQSEESSDENNPHSVSTSESLRKEYQENLDKLANLQNSNKKFTLNSIVFENRITRMKNMAAAQERKRLEQAAYTNTDPDQLLKKLSFPTVPNTIIQGKPS